MASFNGKHFMGTQFGFDESNFEQFAVALDSLPGVKGYAFQLERCPDTGNLHIQWYLGFNRKIRASSVTERLRDALEEQSCSVAPHVEGCYDPKAAAAYAQKDETRVAGPVIFGDLPGTKPKSNLATAADMVWQGKPMWEVAEAFPTTYVQFGGGLHRLLVQRHAKPVLRAAVEVFVRWGDTGTGKTLGVYQSHPIETIYSPLVQGRSIWFDHYQGEDVLLLDDFNPQALDLTDLLKVLDVYPMKCQAKFGFITPKWTKVYITSNLDPRDWYPGASQTHLQAMFRRFKNVTHFSKEFNYVRNDQHVFEDRSHELEVIDLSQE